MGGGPSSSASSKSDQSFGGDSNVYNIVPALPPGQSQSWLMPAIIGGAVLLVVFLTKK